MADGLSLPEPRALMTPLGAAERLAGVGVACFNPDRDPDGCIRKMPAGLLGRTIVVHHRSEVQNSG